MSSIYDIEVETIEEKKIKMGEYAGSVLLIVNVASACGFTPQYQDLEKLYQKYQGRNFKVLGFPCNQFGEQEQGNNKEIADFCSSKFHVTFPMFAKIDVNGDATHPLYQHLKSTQPGILGTEGVKWNFTKFLVDSKGQVVDRYAPQTKPFDIEEDIVKLLC